VLRSVLLALVLGVPSTHPDSLSRSTVRVEGARATVELRFQALSLLEVLPAVDRSEDGWLDAGELEAARDVLEDYLLEHFRLAAVSDEGETALEGRMRSAVAQDPAALGAFELQNLDVSLAFEAARPIERLALECTLFREANPWHKDTCFLTWNQDEEVPHLFEGQETRWLFEPAHVRRPGVLGLFLRLGIDHILGGYDHQAFLLALLVASRRARSLLGVVTAFTLAHSVTLAAAALGLVHVPARFVELAIALSIAYVACDNLLRKEPRTPWLEAFLFGLLHGLGFAGFLAGALAGEPLVLTALVGFNLGVEIGQLGLVLLCLGAIVVLFRAHRGRARTDPSLGLVPPRVRSAVSAVVASSGFFWFLERAGWWPWS